MFAAAGYTLQKSINFFQYIKGLALAVETSVVRDLSRQINQGTMDDNTTEASVGLRWDRFYACHQAAALVSRGACL